MQISKRFGHVTVLYTQPGGKDKGMALSGSQVSVVQAKPSLQLLSLAVYTQLPLTHVTSVQSKLAVQSPSTVHSGAAAEANAAWLFLADFPASM